MSAPAPPSPARPAPRTARQLLVDRTFGLYFFGNLVSNCGNWVQNVAAAVVVFNLTGSATLTGAVSVALWLGSLVLSPYAGAVTDRVDRRRLLIGAQSVAATAAGTLAVWTGVVGADGLPGPWPILGATLVIGVGLAFSVPAMQALVPALVAPQDLDQAIALNSVTFNVARAAGPALGAGILLWADPATAFAINACTYAALIVVLLVIRPRPVRWQQHGDGSVREGLRHVRGDRMTAILLLAMAGLGIASDPINTLTPPLAAELGGGDALVGLLVAAFGTGAAATTLVVTRVRRWWGQERVGVIGLGVMGAGMAGLGASPTAVFAAAALLAAGAGFLMAITSLTTRLQRRVPEALRGRVMALWGLAFLGSRPLAALVDGVAADLTSPRMATVVAATTAVTAALMMARTDRAALRAG